MCIVTGISYIFTIFKTRFTNILCFNDIRLEREFTAPPPVSPLTQDVQHTQAFALSVLIYTIQR